MEIPEMIILVFHKVALNDIKWLYHSHFTTALYKHGKMAVLRLVKSLQRPCNNKDVKGRPQLLEVESHICWLRRELYIR